jgi:hypothetical protein
VGTSCWAAKATPLVRVSAARTTGVRS